jgi:D-3-phosphoglycerate dehydrogenase
MVSADVIRELGGEPASISDLLQQSDAVTLHCPSTPETRGLLNSQSLQLTKPGTVIINLARGDLIDPQALTEALQSGHVSAAALDVFSPEPIPPGHPILSMPQVVLASHIASASVPAVRRLRETAAGLALAALEGRPLVNIVNGVRK